MSLYTLNKVKHNTVLTLSFVKHYVTLILNGDVWIKFIIIIIIAINWPLSKEYFRQWVIKWKISKSEVHKCHYRHDIILILEQYYRNIV